MSIEQRISFITLGVADLARSREFYEALGWKPAHAQGDIVFFQMNGLVLALFPREELAKDAAVPDDGSSFRGVSVSYNVRGIEEVAQVLEHCRKAGAKIVKPAQDTEWGGHSGYFADPDGHLWEVAWNPFLTITEDSNIVLGNG